MIAVACATCPNQDRFKSRAEARRCGWAGMGWRRPFKLCECTRGRYWGMCPRCCKELKEVMK